ncbi:MAG: rhodanese-like domain-containing protein [Nitrospirota bacterium]
MKKKSMVLIGILLLLISTIPVFAEDSDLVERIDKILSKGPEHDNYHVAAWQLNKWIKMGRTDFQVIDVRMPPDNEVWGQPKYGRIPGSIYIPYTELFRSENLKKLPKDKKLIFVGHMNVYENYLVVPLRLIGYDAYIMLLGMSGWQKDYPASGHIKSLLHDAQKQDFPLAKEAEGKMTHKKHKGHKR